jgi:hypothetical protein
MDRETRVQPILNIRDVPGRHQVDNLAMAEGGPHAGVRYHSFVRDQLEPTPHL